VVETEVFSETSVDAVSLPSRHVTPAGLCGRSGGYAGPISIISSTAILGLSSSWCFAEGVHMHLDASIRTAQFFSPNSPVPTTPHGCCGIRD
jgi:hypothetical protein